MTCNSARKSHRTLQNKVRINVVPVHMWHSRMHYSIVFYYRYTVLTIPEIHTHSHFSNEKFWYKLYMI